MEQANRSATRYAGFIIVLAFLIGGTSAQGKWTDALLLIAMIPATFVGFSHIASSNISVFTKVICAAILSVLAIQFLPVDLGWGFPKMNDGSDSLKLWTSNPGRTINSVAITISLLGYFLYIATFTKSQQQDLTKFVFLGLGLNVLIAIVQLSFSSNIETTGLLPYTIRMGIFQNENHFASLGYAAIPLLAWYFLYTKKQWIGYVSAGALIVFLQFAIGSRSGMIVSGSVFLLCVLVWATDSLGRFRRISVLAVTLICVMALVASVDHSILISEESRAFYNQQTWKIASQYWLTGTGLGSFFSVWPMFETADNILPKYITHAHNDHLELFMEIGAIYFFLLAAFILLLVAASFRNPLSSMCAISVFALTIHSLVDYPLRTMALSLLFSLFCAILFSNARNLVGQHRPK